MPGSRTWWIAVALGFGFAVALAPPALLLWNFLHPRPWDSSSFRVRFESVRYERAALVFTYLLQNRTRRAARLLPELTSIRALQSANAPLVGFPAMQLPLDVPARSSQHVEVRLELPARDRSHFPMRTPPARADSPPDTAALLETPLRNLDGFELINQSKGVRILFPRGW